MMQKLWAICLLAGLLSGCKTMPVETCITYHTDKGWGTYVAKESPMEYLECITGGMMEMAHFPYIIQSLKESNADLVKKYKNPAKIRHVLKEEEIYDTIIMKKGKEKSKKLSIREGHLSNLLYWMLDKTSPTQQGIAVYNIYGGLQAEAGAWDLPLCLSDKDLEKMPIDPKTSSKVMVSLTPLTEGMYALVVPIRDAGSMLGWMVSYYSF